ncbi:MAG: signal peptidase I [Lachnospiraceae bacterium]|nr:signal peptidase I [Lachnospiraceae bacterium]
MVKEEKKIRKLTTEQIERELNRVRYKQRYGRTLRSTVYILIVVAAMAILAATFVFPVFRIYGNSMTPTLEEGQIIVSLKETDLETGDIIAFYYNNKILVKRVIANTGDWVNIDTDGNVYVNDVLLDEPYIKEKAMGECNITLPYQIPEGKTFVLGDHRSVSMDSRHTSVGCISEEQIVGKLIMRIWPLNEIKIFD